MNPAAIVGAVLFVAYAVFVTFGLHQVSFCLGILKVNFLFFSIPLSKIETGE